MATPSDPAVINAILSGTTPDTCTLLGPYAKIMVTNFNSTTMWLKLDGTPPTAGTNGNWPVPGNASAEFYVGKQSAAGNTVVIGVLGNGNTYCVAGLG